MGDIGVGSCSGRVQHLVVDAAAFIKNERLEAHGSKIHTLQRVLDEVRHAPTRQRLSALPYQLQIANVQPDCLKVAKMAAQLTGDLPSLSATDLHVIALTYQLTRQFDTQREVVTEPKVVKREVPAFRVAQRGPENAPKVSESGDRRKSGRFDSCEYLLILDNSSIVSSRCSEHGSDVQGAVQHLANCQLTDQTSDEHKENPGHDNATAPVTDDCHSDTCSSGGDTETESETDSGAEDDWITEDNFQQFVTGAQSSVQAGGDAVPDDAHVVACITSDFAIQNVLLHMRLGVMSVDGLMVRQLRSYLMRCRACFKTTKPTNNPFCQFCGHASLDKVPVTVTPDGVMHVYLSRRRLLNTRGLKHANKAPSGGKHPTGVFRVTEDHSLAMNKPSKKAIAKLDPFDPDFAALDSPFSVHDTNSRSVMLGVRANGGPATRRANPNAYARGKKRGGKRR